MQCQFLCVHKKDCKTLHIQKHYNYSGLLKIAVMFTGLDFYTIAKMQQHSKSVIKCDYGIEVLLNSVFYHIETRSYVDTVHM